MAAAISPQVRKALQQFTEHRIDCIRRGDRDGLDQTYSPSCLGRRNKYNRHDFKWYMDMIELGFGEDTAQIDIRPFIDWPELPFSGFVTFPWPPEYLVFVETVSRRRTLWLIRIFQDGPKVVLPAFGGRTADQVATGEWKMSSLPEERQGETILKFHPQHFVSDVANSTASILMNWASRLKYETIRAVALDSAPWHGQCWIALLTTQEDFPEDKCGKWAIGDWRWNELEEVRADLCRIIRLYYEGETETDREKTLEERADVIFQCLADALQSDVVAASLRKFNLAADFELGVFNPDDSKNQNYCRGR
jgi:hypothetical protein